MLSNSASTNFAVEYCRIMYNIVELCRKMLAKNDVEKCCRIMFVSNSTENIVANNIRQKIVEKHCRIYYYTELILCNIDKAT